MRRETASAYLQAAGVDVRAPRARRLGGGTPARPASDVTTDSYEQKPASDVTTDSDSPEPEPASDVTTDSVGLERLVTSPCASAAEP